MRSDIRARAAGSERHWWRSAWGGAFEDEIDPQSSVYRTGYRRGIVAISNAGPDTNGSQFFILHRDHDLSPNYVIFARVMTGETVVDAIADLPATSGPGGEMSKPVTRSPSCSSRWGSRATTGG